VANGLILPVAGFFLLLVLNQREKMGGLTNTRIQNLLGGWVILIVSALGIWHIVRVFFR
jgi:Mn2+/Fe2+ NRAMP family transporter